MGDTPAQSYDVCVVCALPEEVKALLAVVQPVCEGPIQTRISPLHRYEYRAATVKNTQGESLTLHISWLPRYGPQEMTLHLERVLQEYQPRIAVMTGICAGDATRVQLGNLVVAERTFTYDNGKFVLDEQGQRVHLHDTMTYQLDANLLGFLGLFDAWKPLVARLKRPASAPGQRKKREIVCHVKAMASGNAVRADHPFEDVRVPVRGTVAIDMEGAAFGLVMSRHPLIPWLIVKGVCDYADGEKNDLYHDYAARASVLYALSFLRAYVTNERLPRSSPTSQTELSVIQNLPFARNPFFTEREAELEQLHIQLQQDKTAVVGQTHAISGLGGIGKTQLAVEYAYRHHEEYQYILWARAESVEALTSSFAELAHLLDLPEKAAQEQEITILAVKRWLQRERGWLLILDNADTPDLLPAFLPPTVGGHLLITTRAADVDTQIASLPHPLEVNTFSEEQGTLFLLHRSALLALGTTLDQADAYDRHLAMEIAHELGGLPLALDQAGAYLKATGCDLATYQQLYQKHRTTLLSERRGADHPEPVARTWLLSFEQVEQKHAAAADLLRLCAFLAPDAIPEELLTQGASELGPVLGPVVTDALLLGQAIEALRAYSLIGRDSRTHTLSMHRLVQAVLRESLEDPTRNVWMERTLRAVQVALPAVEHAKWPQWERIVAQAQACATWMEQPGASFAERARLLQQTGWYLTERARYGEAQALLERAYQISLQELGPEHLDTAREASTLARLYYTLGKNEQAEPLYQRALAIREQQLGPQHPDTASSLNDLATLYRTLGKNEQAEPLYQHALSIYEQQLGPLHPWTASSLNNLADLYRTQGKLALAALLYQRALSIHEQRLGPGHPDTATSLNNLALLYQAQGKHVLAEPLLRRALAIYEQHMGPEHPWTATSLNNLAALYHALGKHVLAEPLLRRALAVDEKAYGPEHPDVATDLNNLAALYYALGKYEQTEPLHQRALAIREQHLGPNHPDTAQSLNNLADLYQAQGKYDEAEPLYQRALHTFDQALGPEHPHTQTVRRNYARLLRAMGRDDEARRLETDGSQE